MTAWHAIALTDSSATIVHRIIENNTALPWAGAVLQHAWSVQRLRAS